MTPALLLGGVAAGLIAVFLGLRRYAYPADALGRELPAPAVAVAQARVAVHRLCGLDVTGWRTFPAAAADDAMSELLHQLGIVDGYRGLLEAWGLRGTWRVRFVRGDATVRIGLSAGGDVLLFDLNREAEDLLAGRRGVPPDEAVLRDRLGALWRTVARTGRGERTRDDGSVDRACHFAVETPDVRVEAVVRTAGAAVTGVDTAVVPASDRARAVELAGATESLANLGGTLGSLLALAVGIGILAQLGGPGRPAAITLAVGLGAALLVAVAVTEPADLRYVAVDAFDGRTSWRVFRTTILLTALCTGIVMAGVAAVAVLAGYRVAAEVGIPILGDPVRQLGWGGFLAAAWLGVAAAGWALLRRTGLAEHAAAPDARLLRQDPAARLRAVTVAVQSSIGEETVYRLLAVPVIMWATGSAVVAVGVSAMLWAAMHSGSAVRPRLVRFAELTVVGCGLGAAMVTVGLLAPLLAHAGFNAAMLLAAQRGSSAGGHHDDVLPAAAREGER